MAVGACETLTPMQERLTGQNWSQVNLRKPIKTNELELCKMHKSSPSPVSEAKAWRSSLKSNSDVHIQLFCVFDSRFRTARTSTWPRMGGTWSMTWLTLLWFSTGDSQAHRRREAFGAASFRVSRGGVLQTTFTDWFRRSNCFRSFCRRCRLPYRTSPTPRRSFRTFQHRSWILKRTLRIRPNLDRSHVASAHLRQRLTETRTNALMND